MCCLFCPLIVFFVLGMERITRKKKTKNSKINLLFFFIYNLTASIPKKNTSLLPLLRFCFQFLDSVILINLLKFLVTVSSLSLFLLIYEFHQSLQSWCWYFRTKVQANPMCLPTDGLFLLRGRGERERETEERKPPTRSKFGQKKV